MSEVKIIDDQQEYLQKEYLARLRDDFAAKAMQGMLSCDSHETEGEVTSMANWAYEVSDAMLKARDKTTS